MMHDFLITEEHVVFMDSPIVLNIGDADGGPVAAWKPENGTRLGRHAPPGHGRRHHAGSTSTPATSSTSGTPGATATASSCAAPAGRRSTSATRARAAPSRSSPRCPARFWIDLSAGKAGWEHFDDMGGEMCRFNDDYNGVYNRYDYMAAYTHDRVGLGGFDAIAGYDAATGTRQVWDFGGEREVGEPVFAPDPNGTDEGDGWVLCLATDRAATFAELNVFEARRIDDGPVAVVRLPQWVPAGFHANWFPA